MWTCTMERTEEGFFQSSGFSLPSFTFYSLSCCLVFPVLLGTRALTVHYHHDGLSSSSIFVRAFRAAGIVRFLFPVPTEQ